jgi:cobalt-zinc-cadmium efflux system outer membrane protein
MSLGINAEREFDGARNVGPEVEFAVPIFNRGQGKLAAITAEKTKLEARLRQLELDADLQIAQSLNTMDSARSQLHILRAGMAAAEKRVALSHREVNFMLTSPLELLTIKRQQIQLAHEFTATLKNYWQARAQLELAVGTTLNSDSANANSHSADHGHPSQPQPEKHETHQEHHHD